MGWRAAEQQERCEEWIEEKGKKEKAHVGGQGVQRRIDVGRGVVKEAKEKWEQGRMFADIPFSTEEMKEGKRGLEKSGQRRGMSWWYGKRVGENTKKKKVTKRENKWRLGLTLKATVWEMFVTWQSYHYCHLKITLAIPLGLGGCGLRNGKKGEGDVITAALLACRLLLLNIHIGNWDWEVMFLGKCQTDSLPASPENYLDMQTATKTGRGYLFICPSIYSSPQTKHIQRGKRRHAIKVAWICSFPSICECI